MCLQATQVTHSPISEACAFTVYNKQVTCGRSALFLTKQNFILNSYLKPNKLPYSLFPFQTEQIHLLFVMRWEAK